MRRRLHWGMAMVAVRADRTVRPAIRELRQRAPGGSAPTLSGWRGLSGRAHIVRVLPLDPEAVAAAGAGVLIAVRREADGFAHIVAIGRDAMPASWWARARDAGATELHVHCLADGPAARAAVMMDLSA